MVDGALAAHVLQGAAHPGEQGRVAGVLEAVEDTLLVGAEGLTGQGYQGVGAPGAHMDGDRAGGLQGAPVGGLEPHLQGDVEQEPTAHVRLGPAALGGGGLRVPVGLEALVLGQGCGDQPVAVECARLGVVESGLGPLLNGHLRSQRPAQGRAQAHRVGALVDVAGAVGGVLHGVGEDEGAFLGVVEGVVAEQGGQ